MQYPRLSKRELFALILANGILSDPEDWKKFKGLNCSQSTARYAVQFADDLLLELKKTRPRRRKSRKR